MRTARQLLEADDMAVNASPRGDRTVGRWFQNPSTGAIVYIRSHLVGDKYATTMFSADLSVGPLHLNQRFDPSWIPTEKPANVGSLMAEALVNQLLEQEEQNPYADEKAAILADEAEALRTDADLYLECMNGRPMKERTTAHDIRQGLILYWNVYRRIKPKPEPAKPVRRRRT